MSYKFFQNKACEYFPCHTGADASSFNCLFCYCPLYALGEKCGGDFSYTSNGIKDCSACLIPHSKDGYERVRCKIGQVLDLAREK